MAMTALLRVRIPTLSYSVRSLTQDASSTYRPGIPKKSETLRKMLFAHNKLTHMMEAHSGHSAKIAEEAGFKAIWGSGLSISAQIGFRDANEASPNEVIAVADYINQAVSAPVLLDGDTGFGNFNNARRLVQRLELLGVAGVCMEDKLFPKTNSFIVKGAPQVLAGIEEFCLKIKACKEAQRDPDFCVVARVEALIADHGMDEAILRAEEYRKAGADAILIHSKKAKADEIREFLKIWNKRHPIVIVPTKYAMDTDAEEMRNLGVNLMIWANHNIRASTKAMQEVSKSIWEAKHCRDVEKTIATVDEIFRLQKEKDLARDEDIFSPKTSATPQVEKYTPAVVPAKGVCPTTLVNHLRASGVTFACGLPDSLLDNFINALPPANVTAANEPFFHHIAASEGAALAIASGYQVATTGKAANAKPPLVYLQNSGFGNLINVLLSCAHKNVFSIPSVIVMGWRGDPAMFKKPDEPQHRVQGGCMLEMLKAMNMDTFILGPTDSQAKAHSVMDQAFARATAVGQPVFVCVRPNTFEAPLALYSGALPRVNPPTYEVDRRGALRALDAMTASWTSKVCSTGKMSRDQYEITTEKPGSICQSFLMVGSMGYALSFAAGVCYSGFKDNVLCLDGDGSLLMHLGTLGTVNSLPVGARLLHVGLNNTLHESVGTQPSAASYPAVSFSGAAKSLGYTRVVTVKTTAEAAAFVKEFEAASSSSQPLAWFMEWLISPTKPGGKELARPKETPVERKLLFNQAMNK